MRRDRPISKHKRASRLAEDWQLPPEWQQWAVDAYHVSPAQAVRISLKFRDHWLGKAGPNAVKVDWLATWRNWVRTTIERDGK